MLNKKNKKIKELQKEIFWLELTKKVQNDEINFLAKKARSLKLDNLAYAATFDVAVKLIGDLEKDLRKLRSEKSIFGGSNNFPPPRWEKEFPKQESKYKAKTSSSLNDEGCKPGTCEVCDGW